LLAKPLPTEVIVAIKLPPVIQNYVEVSNRHDVKPILACFADNALVHDEGKDFRGKKMIEDWIVKTIDKYKFHFDPVTVREDGAEIVVAIEVSGTFPGSPVTPDYHFVIENDNILSLTID
jgi:ketosteroid isomerase-like protein